MSKDKGHFYIRIELKRKVKFEINYTADYVLYHGQQVPVQNFFSHLVVLLLFISRFASYNSNSTLIRLVCGKKSGRVVNSTLYFFQTRLWRNVFLTRNKKSWNVNWHHKKELGPLYWNPTAMRNHIAQKWANFHTTFVLFLSLAILLFLSIALNCFPLLFCFSFLFAWF